MIFFQEHVVILLLLLQFFLWLMSVRDTWYMYVFSSFSSNYESFSGTPYEDIQCKRSVKKQNKSYPSSAST